MTAVVCFHQPDGGNRGGSGDGNWVMDMDDWPDGPADQKAARSRYLADLTADRQAIQEVFRADLPAAHVGVGVVVLASILTGFFAGPWFGVLVTVGFVGLFLAALTVVHLLGGRGRGAIRRAYLATFGWGNWV